jgi:hypothetical protein
MATMSRVSSKTMIPRRAQHAAAAADVGFVEGRFVEVRAGEETAGEAGHRHACDGTSDLRVGRRHQSYSSVAQWQARTGPRSCRAERTSPERETSLVPG